MKQDLQALEQKRKDVADLRHIRITKRRPFMADHLERLAFIEETSVKTNMARTTGWAPTRTAPCRPRAVRAPAHANIHRGPAP